MNRYLYFFISLIIFNFGFGQEKDSLKIKKKVDLYSLNDTLLVSEVHYVPQPKFKDKGEKIAYLRLKIRIFKTYAYAKETARIYLETKKEIDSLGSKWASKKHIKEKQEQLMDKYEQRLRKLSQKDGQVLSKLIHREAGHPTYTIIKEMRSSWSAFWWNTKANFFNISLKTPYNPANIKEDSWIENILQRAYSEGRLKPLDLNTIQKLQLENPDYNYLNLSGFDNY